MPTGSGNIILRYDLQKKEIILVDEILSYKIQRNKEQGVLIKEEKEIAPIIDISFSRTGSLVKIYANSQVIQMEEKAQRRLLWENLKT